MILNFLHSREIYRISGLVKGKRILLFSLSPDFIYFATPFAHYVLVWLFESLSPVIVAVHNPQSALLSSLDRGY